MTVLIGFISAGVWYFETFRGLLLWGNETQGAEGESVAHEAGRGRFGPVRSQLVSRRHNGVIKNWRAQVSIQHRGTPGMAIWQEMHWPESEDCVEIADAGGEGRKERET